MNDKSELLQRIRTFLTDKDWSLSKENINWAIFSAPEYLKFEEPFTLFLPNNSDFAGFADTIQRIIRFLSEVYEIDEDEIINFDMDSYLNPENSVMSIRLIDKNTENGTVSLPKISDMLSELPKLISSVGNFILDKNLVCNEKNPKIDKFLSDCQFMQTEKGSFIVKIQMPSEFVIKEPDLFDMETIKSESISKKMQQILEFVTEKVFSDSEEIKQEDFVTQNFQLLSVDVLNSLSSIISKARMEEIDFSFTNKGNKSKIKITDTKSNNLAKLQNYTKFLENLKDEVVPVDCYGKIIEMKSRNPQGDSNSITLQTDDEKGMKITACLKNEDYQNAIDAHKESKKIHITGTAKKYKNSLRMKAITNFQTV